MLKEKLLSQMEVLENLQKGCTVADVDEALKLGSQILHIARKLDEIEEAQEPKEKELIVTIDGEEIFTKSILQHKQGA